MASGWATCPSVIRSVEPTAKVRPISAWFIAMPSMFTLAEPPADTLAASCNPGQLKARGSFGIYWLNLSGHQITVAFGTKQFASAGSPACCGSRGLRHKNTNVSSESSRYILEAKLIWRVLLRQLIPLAFAFALPNAGSNMLARIPMMAITTNNSIKVNPRAPRACAEVEREGNRMGSWKSLWKRPFTKIRQHTERRPPARRAPNGPRAGASRRPPAKSAQR